MSKTQKTHSNPRRRDFLKKAGLVGAVGGTVVAGQAHRTGWPCRPREARKPEVRPGPPATKTAATTAKVDISGLPRVKQKLVDPPFVPEHEQVAEHAARRSSRSSMTVEEKKIEIDDDGT